jgi:hypothetical protein
LLKPFQLSDARLAKVCRDQTPQEIDVICRIDIPQGDRNNSITANAEDITDMLDRIADSKGLWTIRLR